MDILNSNALWVGLLVGLLVGYVLGWYSSVSQADPYDLFDDVADTHEDIYGVLRELEGRICELEHKTEASHG